MLTSFYIKEKAVFFIFSIIEGLSDLLIFFIKQQETYIWLNAPVLGSIVNDIPCKFLVTVENLSKCFEFKSCL